MYTCPELEAATDKLIKCAKAKDILLGMFQFGTDRVTEFLDKDFNFISVGNDLHHCLTQNFAHKEALVACSVAASKPWNPQQCALVPPPPPPLRCPQSLAPVAIAQCGKLVLETIML
jgi:4-hydroxy-2-oxoheptanedioate aldolase